MTQLSNHCADRSSLRYPNHGLLPTIFAPFPTTIAAWMLVSPSKKKAKTSFSPLGSVAISQRPCRIAFSEISSEVWFSRVKTVPAAGSGEENCTSPFLVATSREPSESAVRAAIPTASGTWGERDNADANGERDLGRETVECEDVRKSERTRTSVVESTRTSGNSVVENTR